MNMLERDGDVIRFTIPKRDHQNIIGAIQANVLDGTEIHTDAAQMYKVIRNHEEYTHMTVDHSISESVGR